MTDRELRDASARMNAALRRVAVPEPPSRLRRPALLAFAAAAAVIVLVGGWALFVRDGQGRLDAENTAATLAPLLECEPTTPPGGFTPPEPWPAAAPEGVWYGTADLWTELPPEGHSWFGLPVAPGGGLTQKLFWWSQHFDVQQEPEPAMLVTARRLDAEGPTVVDRHATNGRRADMGHFMLAGMELPSEGCWEITGEYRGAVLTFVAEVGPGLAGH